MHHEHHGDCCQPVEPPVHEHHSHIRLPLGHICSGACVHEAEQWTGSMAASVPPGLQFEQLAASGNQMPMKLEKRELNKKSKKKAKQKRLGMFSLALANAAA